MTETSQLAWGILSTGNIAHTFARGLRDSNSGRLVAVASRNQESADRFGEEFQVPHRFASYEALLADAEVQAVYIGLPHPLHAEWAIKAADAGKHILCEKPLTLNYPDAQRVVEAARRNGVLLIEAFMYRCHPLTAKIVEVVRAGTLGQVRQIEASFSFQSGGDPSSRLHDLELGGGGILDVGCYTVSLARLVAGAATGKEFAEPTEVKALAKIGATGADDYTTALLRFPGDILAVCSTGVMLEGGGSARIIGTAGRLIVPSPWFSGNTLSLELHGKDPRGLLVESDRSLYAYEADLFAASVRAGRVLPPAQGAEDALGNMRALDLWRKEIGLSYPHEAPERQSAPTGGPLRVRANHMKYGELERVTRADGTPKRISKIVLGTMLEGAITPFTHGLALFDDFFERGGTCFDTAHIYAGGFSEKVMGHWINTRGVRDEVVIIGKGAHTPDCHPEGLTRQLDQSLARLNIEGVDIYMMHRDNPDIPAGVFVEVLNEQVRAGKMREFGGSNWTIERLEEANTYAREKGLQGFTVVSNNFSLARMVDPIWAGGVSSSDPKSRTWFEKNQLALFSWSSQARGFFARGDRSFTADGELTRCWYSDDNFERLRRAGELAQKRGVSPVVIAAAYVLTQPFPIYALIGPRTLAETSDSMHAFDVELTPEEVRWLNLEA